MQWMTITYPNGTVLEAILLFHRDDELRAGAPACDDVLAFTRVHGTWVSEDSEPVTIEFEWQRRTASHVYSEDDCICPKELAARLISILLGGSEWEEAASKTLYVFRPDGNRICIHRSELQVM